MGTPDFAVGALLKIDDIYGVAAVITQPDKPKGRGYELIPTPVKAAALEREIPVYQPETLKNGEILPLLEEIKPDVIVVCAYGKILPEYILNYPTYGCINIHASLLPKYRGAAPINWCVIDGEKESGVTIMKMEKGLDTGDMMVKRSVAITPETTAGSLHDELAVIGAEAAIDALSQLENGTATYEKQNDAESNYAVMLNKEICKIDFNKTSKEVANHIKGLSPFPGAYFTLEGKIIKVLFATECEEKIPAGVIPDGKSFKVGTADGSVILTRVKPEGKKEMDGAGFMAGRRQKGGKADVV